jgi:hypothetical protein
MHFGLLQQKFELLDALFLAQQQLALVQDHRFVIDQARPIDVLLLTPTTQHA